MADQARPSGNMFNQQALAGLIDYAGEIQVEWDKALRGREGMKKYQEMMESNATVGGLMNAIEITMSSVPWGFEPPKDYEGPEKPMERGIDLGDSWLDDMSIPWSETVTAQTAYLGYGYQAMEVIWKYRRGEDADPPSFYDDGMIGLRKLLPIPQVTVYRWLFDKDGSLEGLEQLLDNGQRVEVPIAKMMVLKTRYHHGSPEGRSILRPAYPNYYYLTHFEEMEAIGVERDVVGIPVIRLPRGADKDPNSAEYQAARDLGRNLKRDDQQSIILPPPYGPDEDQKYEVELLGTSAGATRLSDDDKIIRRHQWQIMMSVLTQFLQLGSGDTGTYALSKDLTDLFVMSVHSRLDQMASYLNRYVFRPLFRVNALPGLEAHPVLVPSRVTEGDVTALVDSVFKLMSVGAMMADNDTEDWLRSKLSAPERTVDRAAETNPEEDELTPVGEVEGLE